VRGMIISASRRTDIPAFYADWFIKRIRVGYCTVPNPFNPRQVAYVSLRPEEVDAIVFWTRNPRPLMPYLDELDHRGFRYYFQFTLMGNPREIDPKSPPLERSLTTFRELSNRIGAERVIWRYDPIVFSNRTGAAFHLTTYRKIAETLRGSTHRSVISLMDWYRKAAPRLRGLSAKGIEIIDFDGNLPGPRFETLMESMAATTHENGMGIFSCAEKLDLRPYGIQPGKCIDDALLREVFKIKVEAQKDLSQREACGCVKSKEIGMYDTCLFGCQYCYATSDFERAKRNHREHDPGSPSLLDYYEASPALDLVGSPDPNTDPTEGLQRRNLNTERSF
jgi:hypothetical protein